MLILSHFFAFGATVNICEDDDIPTVEITKPMKRSLYINNRWVRSWWRTTILRGIDIEVDAYDKDGIDRVEFYIGKKLKSTDTTEPYTWTWDERVFGSRMIVVKAYDNKTYSGTTDYVVLIDVFYVKNIGYLIDTNSNGTYDSFYSNETLNETDVELLENGSYLINSDEDDEWDYYYDPVTDTLTPYTPGEEAEDYTIWYLLIIGLIIAIILLFLIAAAMKKKEKEKERKKSEK